MKLPSEEQSLHYFEEYKVPGNIKAHCLRVRDVSRYLAEQLSLAGESVNVVFADRLGLFHDLFKAVALAELKPNRFHAYVPSLEEIEMWKKLKEKYRGMYEGEIAYLVFKKDYPRLAVALKNVSNPHAPQDSWEEKTVHYADWRVFQDKIVPIGERLVYLRERYPRTDDAWDLFAERIKELESEIFSRLSFTPDELGKQMGGV